MYSSKSAFTLVEILIVISLIAVFSVMAAVNYNSARRSIEFTSVFLSLTEMMREARNFAINSRVATNTGTTTGRVPFAYAVEFKKSDGKFTATGFYDAYKTSANNGNTTYYLFDGANNKDDKIAVYEIPYGYTMSFLAGDALDIFNPGTLDNLIIGFQPPYGDVYISSVEKNTHKLYKNAGIELKSISTGASKWICTNSIGGVIEESLTGCLK